jgi:cell wall assembly regulator SMI1
MLTLAAARYVAAGTGVAHVQWIPLASLLAGGEACCAMSPPDHDGYWQECVGS